MWLAGKVFAGDFNGIGDDLLLKLEVGSQMVIIILLTCMCVITYIIYWGISNIL